VTKILVIEDEINISFVLKTFLNEEGYEVVVAENGTKGLSLLQTQLLPDVILLDLKMPGMKGRVVAETIKANERLKRIPIVIISGSFSNSKDFPPKDAYNAYITKPFELLEVLEVIKKLTNHRKNIAI